MAEKTGSRPRKPSARSKIRQFFIANVGKVITIKQIADEGGINENARRIRELRDKEGMAIRSHVDRHDLKPGEYILGNLDFKPSVGSKLRNQVLERGGYTCQLCGTTSGDPSAYNPNRKIRLHADHIVPESQGGKTEIDNLRTLCSNCNQGRQNIEAPSETAKNILARIRRLPRAEQREVYAVLKRSFPEDQQARLIPVEGDEK